MIYDDILNLRQYIGENVGVYCHIGMKDFDPNQYPIVQIVPDQTMTLTMMNVKSSTIDIPLTLKVIADREGEQKAFYYFETLLKKLNQYADEKGHEVLQGENIAPEYTDNTYELSIPFMLKSIVQDT